MLFNKVLLATDFSPQSNQLLYCLPELQKFGLREVVLIHVVNVQTSGGNAPEMQEYGAGRLQEEKAQLESYGLKVSVYCLIGFPSQEIERIAEVEEVTLILIASHGQGFIKNIFIGSTAAVLLKTSDHSILLEKYQEVKEGTCTKSYSKNFANVLLPLDLSPISQTIIQRLKTMGLSLQKLTLLHVVENAASPDAYLERHAKAEEELNLYMNELRLVYPEVAIAIAKGDGAAKILDFAREENCSLIILPKKSQPGLKEKFIGGTAQKIAQQSLCTTLLLSEDSIGKGSI